MSGSNFATLAETFATASGLLAGCASGGMAPPPPVAPAEMRVSYTCNNCERVQVRYFPQQGIAVLERDGQNSELQQSVTPPGFTCSGGQTTLRAAQDRLTMPIVRALCAAGVAAMLVCGSPGLARGGAEPKGEFSYVCANGDRFTVQFVPDTGQALLVRRGETIEMQRQPAPSGFLFVTGNTSIAGTAEQLTLNVPGFPPLACQSR